MKSGGDFFVNKKTFYPHDFSNQNLHFIKQHINRANIRTKSGVLGGYFFVNKNVLFVNTPCNAHISFLDFSLKWEGPLPPSMPPSRVG